jgi:hypothetical protein
MSRQKVYSPMLTMHEKDAIRTEIISLCSVVGECWLYNGDRTPNGYGHIRINGKSRTTSRFMLAYATHESLDTAFDSCHIMECPFKACCSPLHLFWGTHEDNCQTRAETNRQERALQRWLCCGMVPDACIVRPVDTSVTELDQVAPGQGVDMSVTELVKAATSGWVI